MLISRYSTYIWGLWAPPTAFNAIRRFLDCLVSWADVSEILAKCGPYTWRCTTATIHSCGTHRTGGPGWVLCEEEQSRHIHCVSPVVRTYETISQNRPIADFPHLLHSKCVGPSPPYQASVSVRKLLSCMVHHYILAGQ